MKSHDLNARTLELAHERGIPYADARRELSRRGILVRTANRQRTVVERLLAEHSRAIADRISP